MARLDVRCFSADGLLFCTPPCFLLSPTQKGFSVDGKVEDADEAASYVDKCVFVDSGNTSGDETLEGFVMADMAVINCG